MWKILVFLHISFYTQVNIHEDKEVCHLKNFLKLEDLAGTKIWESWISC